MAKIATFYDHMKDIARQEGCSVTEAMQEAAGMGIRLMEISQNNVMGRETEVEKELSAAGMGISTIPSYFRFGTDTDVDRQSDDLLASASCLGAEKLLVIPGFWQPEDDEAERERQVQNIIACIDRLADKAAARNISLVMEDFDSELSPCSTIEGVRRFVDSCHGLSCCFDTGNFRFMAQDELDAYEALKDKIGHVHLKDRGSVSLNGEKPKTAVDGKELYPVPVGSGMIKLTEIVSRLREDGYDGVYTIEHYDAAKPLEYLKASVAWVKAHLS